MKRIDPDIVFTIAIVVIVIIAAILYFSQYLVH